MSEDPRYRTKDWLEGITNPNTALNNANLTKDDDSTQVVFAVRFAGAEYNITREFYASSAPVDLLFDIEMPNSTPIPGHDQYPIGHIERVPIKISCINKPGITGTKLLWKANAELRRIAKEYPLGSMRSIEEETPTTEQLGGETLYSQRVVLNYRRDTT